MDVSYRFSRTGIAAEYRHNRYAGSWVVIALEPRRGRGVRKALIARGKEVRLVVVPGERAKDARRAANAARKRSDYQTLSALGRASGLVPLEWMPIDSVEVRS